MDMFSILKDINYHKTQKLHKEIDFEKQFNEFMIMRYFSMSPETTFEANMMNVYNKLPKHVKYLFLSSVIEKKDRFLKYIKNNEEKDDTEMIKYFVEAYKVNKDVAKDMLLTTSDEEKEMIKGVYTQKIIRKR